MVDDDVYEWASRVKWCAHRIGERFYAERYVRYADGKQTTSCLHREILGLQPGDKRVCDHINGDGLNNQRTNLRVCSQADNCRAFKRSSKRATSRFRGVSWSKTLKKWIAHIKLNGRSKHIGLFQSEEAAARAYDQAATELFGEFSQLNNY
jgi:hypothetical protein